MTDMKEVRQFMKHERQWNDNIKMDAKNIF